MQESVFLVIPTYNERDNIEKLCLEILDAVPGIQIVVVDDNSPDGTGDLLDAMSRQHPSIRPIHRPAKLGLGTAHIAGFNYALDNDACIILTMDADFSHQPRHLPKIIAAARTADVVIGSRYTNEGATVNFPWHRRFISKGANLFAKRMLHLYALDCTSGYRAYRAQVLRSIDLKSIFSNGYSFLVEILYRCQEAGFEIVESPIEYVARVQGLSKISRSEIVNAFITIFRLKIERVKRRLGMLDVS